MYVCVFFINCVFFVFFLVYDCIALCIYIHCIMLPSEANKDIIVMSQQFLRLVLFDILLPSHLGLQLESPDHKLSPH